MNVHSRVGRLIYRKIIQSNITGVLACLLPNGVWFALYPDWVEDQWKLLLSQSKSYTEQSTLTHKTNVKAANGWHCNVSFRSTRNWCCQMHVESKFNIHYWLWGLVFFSIWTEFIFRNILNSFNYVYKFEGIFMKQKNKRT